MDAVANGRNVYRNIKNAILFLLSGNMAAIFAVVYASLLALPVPFEAVHLLFINLLTDSLPAIAIGMDHLQTMRCVILPQALRNVMPQLGNNLIINIKDTSVLNVISVTELYFASKSAAGVYYKYFEIFFITCVMYFIMTFTASRLLRWAESKMDGPKDYQLVTYDPMMDPCGDIPLPTKKQKGRY